MTKPTDTSKMDPLLILGLAMGDGKENHGRFIEEMEANGQGELVNSTSLPTKINSGYRLPDDQRKAIEERHGEDNWSAANEEIRKIEEQRTTEAFEAMGIVLGEINKDDPMFREARLPQGWKKERTDHSMWSKVVDHLGRERLSIFYKAAFYDRDAHLNISSRFHTSYEYDDWDKDCEDRICFPIVTDAGKEIFRGEGITHRPWPRGETRFNHKTETDIARAQAVSWANENLPEGWDDLIQAWKIEI